MKKTAAILLILLIAACARRTQVEFVNPGFPGKVDTMQVRRVIRPGPTPALPNREGDGERGRNED